MEVKAIKCSDGYFINVKGIRFGDEDVKETWNREWFKVSDVYKTPFKIIPATKKLLGYKLNEGFVATEVLPETVDSEFFKYDYSNEREDHSDIRGVYEPFYEDVPERLEPIELEIQVIAKVEGNLVKTEFSFPVYGKWSHEGKNWSVTEQRVKVSLVDEIITPDILRQEVPCELSSEDSYKIIRTYIKDNIDPKVAIISSDYDFCFTVQKRIGLSEKEEYKVDENFSIFGRKRKPRWVTKYRTERKTTVYETAPEIQGKVYSGYTACPKFTGKNLQDLKENIENYLTEILTEINKPLLDCPKCKGMGVIETA